MNKDNGFWQTLTCRAKEHNNKTGGPWATIISPEWNSHSIFADGMEQFSSTTMVTNKQWMNLNNCHISYLKCIRMLIWPCRRKAKGQSSIIIWINLVDPLSTMHCAQIQPQAFLGSKEERRGRYMKKKKKRFSPKRHPQDGGPLQYPWPPWPLWPQSWLEVQYIIVM